MLDIHAHVIQYIPRALRADWYNYALATVPCTRPEFPPDMATFLKSIVVYDDMASKKTTGFGFAYSSIRHPNNISEFRDKWSKEFDPFDVRT